MSRFGRWGSWRGLVALLAGVVGAVVVGSPALAVGDQAPQVVPSALKRVFAAPNANLDPYNESLDIDGVDDLRLDVDVAVLDSGIDLSHPDLNVVGGVDCTGAEAPTYTCASGNPDAGDDGHGHGTNVALRIGALDNGIGGVGAAAGARLRAVDIHDDATFGSTVSIDLESAIAGLRWVTAHADEIEVAMLALGCAPEQVGESPQPWCRTDGSPTLSALEAELDDAIADAIDAGVVLVGGAGNWNSNVATLIPHRQDDDFLVVSGIVDTDGLPGSLGAGACGAQDDHSWGGNWGALVDVAGPACAASAAAPHVAAAAAILASADNPADRLDVRAIAATIAGDSDCAINSPDTAPNVGAGNCDWTDDSADGIKEPLLDVGDEGVFDPAVVPGPEIDNDDTTIGMYRSGTWDLRNHNSSGSSDASFAYYSYSYDMPVVGDWNGDGVDSVGIYRPTTGSWHLRNHNSAGSPDANFYYYWGASSDVPVVGDWDGDGDDTVGMYRSGTWDLRNSNSSGAPDMTFTYYSYSYDIPVVGDWDGDGDDTVGIYRPTTGSWHLRNSNSAGAPDLNFSYAWGTVSDVPVVGDWDGDGVDTVGMFRPSTGMWELRNANSAGAPDLSVGYHWGASTDKPVVGDWDGS